MLPPSPLPYHASGDALPHGVVIAEPAAPEATPRDTLARAERLADQLLELAPHSDRAGALPEAELDALREGGWLTATLPTRVGGLGIGTTPGTLYLLLRVLREVGRGSLPAGRLYEGHVNALRLVELYGTDAQLETAAREAREGHVFGVWSAEGRGGVTVSPLADGGAQLDGAKVFCSGIGAVTRPIVGGPIAGGEHDGAWQMTLVPMDDARTSSAPGAGSPEAGPAGTQPLANAEAWRAEGMRSTASGHVDFSEVRLGAEHVLGAPDDYSREPHFLAGGIRFTAVHLGGAQALYNAARDHLAKLGRLEHPVQQMRLGAMAAALETGTLWLLGAARLIERTEVAPEACVGYVNLARTAIERACLDVMEAADRIAGARGIGTPGVAERVGRDLRLYLRQPDPDGAQAAGGHFAALHPTAALGSDL